MATQLTESIMMFANRADQVISMTNLRQTGKSLLDRIANREQDKYVVTHDNKPVYVILPFGWDIELNHENQIISTTDLRSGKGLLNRFTNSGQRKYIVMRKNKPIGVVIPTNDECMMEIVIYALTVPVE